MQGDESKEVVQSDVTDDDSVPAVVHGFKVGDVVVKKSGSARMTVKSISDDGQVELSWFNGNNALVEEQAAADELEIATDGLIAAAEKLAPDVVEGAPAGTAVVDEEDVELPEESAEGIQVTAPVDEAPQDAAEPAAPAEDAPKDASEDEAK